ncbi:MAG TPA: hypothetical protein EYQ64_11545 [Gemmatimonadetes bacterium]|nr:hypothetical protein [Gemmatimonadota bacterium]
MTDPTTSEGNTPEPDTPEPNGPGSHVPEPGAPGAGVPELPSKARLAWATLVALLVAAVVLVATVLPAEYDLDPLGIGEALGLRVLSNPSSGAIPVRSDGLLASRSSYRIERKTFELAPDSGWVEYKYRLEAGRAMVYSWTATSWVRSEMHSEADDAPEGTAEFFEVAEETLHRHGNYVAPFPGIHGWYWLNETDETVTVTLHAAGFFDTSYEFRADVDPILNQIVETPDPEGFRPYF